MPILSRPSKAARAALIYITLGALLTVWTIIWYLYLRNISGDSASPSIFYFCYGLFFSGLVLMMIGFAVGRIGRAARHAELPPPEAEQAVENAEQNAAARAPIVAPVNPAMPTGYGNGAVPVVPGLSAVPAPRSEPTVPSSPVVPRR
jgi:hypothetical protein